MERFYYILFYIIKMNLSPITYHLQKTSAQIQTFKRHSKDLGTDIQKTFKRPRHRHRHSKDIQKTSAQTFKRHSKDLGTDIQKTSAQTFKRPRHRHRYSKDIQKTSAQTLNGLLHFRTFPDILLNSRYPTHFPISTYLYFIKRG